jgi:hypothetical protein
MMRLLRKTALILFITLCSVSQLNAQETLKQVFTDIQQAVNTALLTRKGTKMISGSVFYNSSKTAYNSKSPGNLEYTITEKSFSATPAFSYFIANNFSLGLAINYTSNEIESKLPVEILGTKTKQLGFGPVITKFFGKNRTRPFLSLDALYLKGDIIDGKRIDIGAGFIYHISNNIGIGPLATYGLIFPDDESIDSSSNIYIGIGISNFIF